MNAAPIGMTTRKIIVTPCIVKTWLYSAAESSFWPGAASCARMARASAPPIAKKNSDAAPYMMPIFLWSTVLTHARQPVLARGRVKTPSGVCVTAPAPLGSASTSVGRSRFDTVVATPASVGRRRAH